MTDAAERWGARYAAGDTPWDKGRAHPELVARLEAGDAELVPEGDGARALVAGCGRGYDALALARAGWRVTAVDVVDAFLPEIADELRERGGETIVADALADDDTAVQDGAFALVFEHTFLCALDPEQRPAWSRLVRRALAPDGALCAVVFPADKPRSEGGPPWGIPPAEVEEALGEGYERRRLEPVRHPMRDTWRELWGVYVRAGSAS